MASKALVWASDYLYAAQWQLAALRRTPNADTFRLSQESARADVVILPGVYETWRFMLPVIRALRADDHPVHVITTLGYNSGTIAAAADAVMNYVADHRLSNVVLVAHSKGGLVGKYCLSFLNDEGRLAKLVAIAAPFNGSAYARLFPLRAVRDFSRTGATVRELNERSEANKDIVSVYGSYDPHIPGGSKLAGARNVQLAATGHFRILSNRQLLETVVRDTR